MTSSAQKPPGLGHIPALDGIRALALLGVLFFHASGSLKGGFLGVDLFFVLSGFLITSLLVAEHDRKGRIDLRAFWIRRARRLFPALLVLMPAIALYAHFFAASTQVGNIRNESLATLGYIANWQAIFAHKSYWELFASPSPLEHTWSLSIEEQFYILWPLIVLAALRFGGKRLLVAVTTTLLALSVVSMIVLYDPAWTTRVYYGTDSRAAAILAGALLSLLFRSRPTFSTAQTRWLDAIGILAAIGIGASWMSIDGNDRFLYFGGFWLTELAALALIVASLASDRGIVARLLAVRPLTWIGSVSYGAYLWHWPVHVTLTAERIGIHGVTLEALRFAVTFGITYLSYRFIEQPIRLRGVPWGRPWLVVPASILLSVATILLGTRPKPEAAEPFAAVPVIPPDQADFRITVLGDSTANTLGWCIRGLQSPGVSVELKGKDGFNLLTDTPQDPHWTVEPASDAVVVMLSGAFLYGIHVEGRWTRACAPEWQARFDKALDHRLHDLDAVNAPIWIATAPYPLGPYDNSERRAQLDCVNQSLHKAMSSRKAWKVLDLAEIVCPKGECVREFEGHVVRADGVHFEMKGGRGVAVKALEILREDPVRTVSQRSAQNEYPTLAKSLPKVPSNLNPSPNELSPLL